MANSENDNSYEKSWFLNLVNILLILILIAVIFAYDKYKTDEKKVSERIEQLALFINIKNSYEQSYGPESKYRKDIEHLRRFGSPEVNLELNSRDTLLNPLREEYLRAKLSIDSIRILTENNL